MRPLHREKANWTRWIGWAWSSGSGEQKSGQPLHAWKFDFATFFRDPVPELLTVQYFLVHSHVTMASILVRLPKHPSLGHETSNPSILLFFLASLH